MVPLTSAATSAGASIATSSALLAATNLVLAGGDLPPLKARDATPFELERTIQEIVRHGAEFEADLVQRSQRPTKVDSILRALRLAATYRSRTRFDDSEAMAGLRERLQQALVAGRPLALALPLGGTKIPNALKTDVAFLPDVSEWIGWTRLGSLARAIERLSELPTRILIIPEAPLHTADLGVPAFEIARHLSVAQQDLVRLGLAEIVTIADTLSHLPAQWSREVAARADAAARRQSSEPEFAKDASAQVHSLLFGTNLRVYPWSPERQVLVASALSGVSSLPADVVADARRLQAEVEHKVFHHIGVNHSLRSLAIPERLVAGIFGSEWQMIRLTVHAKPGEPQPMLVPESDRARPGLLPMHGIGVRFVNAAGQARFATAFALEARMSAESAVR